MTSAHLGNIEVVLYAMMLRGLVITIPVERVKPPELFAYISTLRTSKGLKLIPVDGPLVDLFRTLRKGHVAGLAADRDITSTGQIANFFGYPAHLPDGHVRLALKTGAPLVVGFSCRNADYTYQATFLPAFHPPPEGTEEERVTAGLKYIIAEMEKAIAQNPEQWRDRLHGQTSLTTDYHIALISPYDFPYPGGVTEHIRRWLTGAAVGMRFISWPPAGISQVLTRSKQ
jgi:lauroyl/myristoyl acyltransferase